MPETGNNPRVQSPPAATRIPAFDRLIGGFAARWPRAMRRLGDLETRVLGRQIASLRIERPVFVCGLARAGSTLLLESLVAAPGFTSLRYSDYPLLWTPYWWNWLRSRLPLPAQMPTERAHRDRLTVTAESPEAFEEVIWMHFFPGRHDPLIDQVLDENCENTAFTSFYTASIRKLLAVRGKQRYVAKGNYNLTRIGYLRHLFPDARFVIAVREPLAHVASLVKQDRLFSALAKADPAVSTHLACSGHFEFGPHKRAGNTGDSAQASAIQACFDAGRSAEAYARQWATSYGWLIRSLAGDPELAVACHLVSYERLCSDPATSLSTLYAHAGIEASTAAALIRQQAPRITAPTYYTPDFTPAECAMIETITAQVWRDLAGRV
ncbi:MAG: sulfotransferase [Rudaea sp.]|nr:sulfotransferase [Rudaea sp.]